MVYQLGAMPRVKDSSTPGGWVHSPDRQTLEPVWLPRVLLEDTSSGPSSLFRMRVERHRIRDETSASAATL